MKWKFIFLLACLIPPLGIQAQNVINAGGQTATAAEVLLEYSVGELATQSFFPAASPMITQGLLQPSLTSPYVIVDVAEPFRSKYAFSCFPNPTRETIFIETDYKDFTRIRIYGPQGQVVRDESFLYEPVSCVSLAAGIYAVRLFSEEDPEFITFKIIKQ